MEPSATDSGLAPSPPPRPAPGRPAPRLLRRYPDEGHIAGVCAGVARYFNVDPVIVRIAAVVLLFSGAGAVAYILAWIFVPEATAGELDGNEGPIDPKDRPTQIFGIALMVLALSVIWGDWWAPGRRWFLPIGLVALGAWLLLRRAREVDEDEEGVEVAMPDRPTDPTAPTWAWTPPSSVLPSPAEPESDPTLSTPVSDGADGPPTEPGDGPPVPPSSGPPVRSRRRGPLGSIVFGALLIWAGLAWLFGVSLQNGLAVGLCLLGVGFVVGSFFGGTRVLILPALLVGAALAVTAVIDIPLVGAVGEQQWAPVDVAHVQSPYEVSIGEGTLDLTGIDLPEGDRLAVEASVGIGHLVILVPRDVALDVTTDVGGGESNVLGVTHHGLGVSTTSFDEEGTTGGTLVLDLQVGVGQVEVIRENSSRPSLSVPS